MNGLSIQHLVAGYNEHVVIHDLSLEVGKKETLVLMGPSGSGKTTLLLSILGIVHPQKGSIRLNGDDLGPLPLEQRNIGYLPQDYGLFSHLTVSGNIAYGLRIRGVSPEQQNIIVEKMLALVQLEGQSDRRIQELSGGQKQRVGLARALAIEPKLLLLDEPLSNIDQMTKRDVATHLKLLFAKLDIPIILVTHNHEDALFLSEKLAILIKGVIEQFGTVKDIIKNPKTPVIKRLLMPFAE